MDYQSSRNINEKSQKSKIKMENMILSKINLNFRSINGKLNSFFTPDVKEEQSCKRNGASCDKLVPVTTELNVDL
jgi:hypothetical protein